MIRSVIFDMDGLMFDTERLAVEAGGKLSEKTGHEGIREALIATLGLNIIETKRVFVERYGEAFDFEGLIEHEKEYILSHTEKHGVPLKPGLIQLLEHLKQTGRTMAVATSSKRERVHYYLDKAGVGEYFDAVVCGDMIKNSKPEPDIYLKAAELLGVHPSGCMVLEDSYAGITSAFRAGMKPVMVPDLLPPSDEIAHMLYASADSLFEIIDLIG